MEQAERSYAENEAAEMVGISRAEARRIRLGSMAEGPHWRKSGREIHLTRAGVEMLIEATAKNRPPRGEDGASAVADLGEGDDSGEGGAETLSVSRLVRNNRILLATTAGGETVRVRVRDSKNFIEGMELRARHAGGDLYHHEGRCPRWKGRW
jgi:hypothetical protein